MCVFRTSVAFSVSSPSCVALRVQVGVRSLRLGFAMWIIGVFFFVDILGGFWRIRRTPMGTVISSAILKALEKPGAIIVRKMAGIPLYQVGLRSLAQMGRVCGSLQGSPRGLSFSPPDLATFNLLFFATHFFRVRNSFVKKLCKPADLGKRCISSGVKEKTARFTKVRSLGHVPMCSTGIDSPRYSMRWRLSRVNLLQRRP